MWLCAKFLLLTGGAQALGMEMAGLTGSMEG